MPHVVSQEDYQEACDSNTGWCTHCKVFCGDFCEPDARKYECPDCGNHTVYGAEEALLQMLITF